jgi:uroporphyrinogen III methyltransferase/synthase
VPEKYVARASWRACGALGVGAGTRVLFPRAEVAREVLPEELAAAGAEVRVLPVYRTGLNVWDGPEARTARLEAGEHPLG